MRGDAKQRLFEIELGETDRRHQRLGATGVRRRDQGALGKAQWRQHRFEAGGDDRGDGDERLGARRTAQQNARARLDIEFAQPRDKGADGEIELREGERRAALLAMIGERRSLGTQTRGAGDQRVEAEHRERMRPRIVGVSGRRGRGVRPREVLRHGESFHQLSRVGPKIGVA